MLIRSGLLLMTTGAYAHWIQNGPIGFLEKTKKKRKLLVVL